MIRKLILKFRFQLALTLFGQHALVVEARTLKDGELQWQSARIRHLIPGDSLTVSDAEGPFLRLRWENG